MNRKPLPENRTDCTPNCRPLPQNADHDKNFVNLDYDIDLQKKDRMKGPNTLEYRHIYHKPTKQFKGDAIITDSHLSDNLQNLLRDLWIVNT